MAHGCAEIIMPIGAVDSIALVKIHRVRHIRQEISRPAHVRVAIFYIDFVCAGHGGVGRGARGDQEGRHQAVAIISIESLFAEIDIQPMPRQIT